MKLQHRQNSLKQIASFLGIASAAIFLGLPAVAQTSTQNGTTQNNIDPSTNPSLQRQAPYGDQNRVNQAPIGTEDESDLQQSPGQNSTLQQLSNQTQMDQMEMDSNVQRSNQIRQNSQPTSGQNNSNFQQSPTGGSQQYNQNQYDQNQNQYDQNQSDQNQNQYDQNANEGVRALW